MTIHFLQQGPHFPPPSGPGVPMFAALLMLIPVLMVIIGTVLGFRALRDIRMAEGRLGGAMLATLAAGLLPAAVILIVCGGGLAMLTQEISPVARRKEDLWVTIGVLAGLWFCFLMMRAMYREATGWVRPAPSQNAPKHSALTAAAIILTVVSSALVLYLLLDARGARNAAWLLGERRVPMFEIAMILLPAGLTCGILARAERPARVCAWICGSLFVVMLLVTAG
jgi:hypothetical protein